MASLAPSAKDLADSVRSELASPTTTTSQTLNVLRAILGLDLESTTSDRQPTQPRSKPTAKRPPPKPRTAAKPTKRAQTQPFPIHESGPAAPKPLELKERRLFATETFNATLKTLSLAARVKQQQHCGAPTKTVPQTRREPQPLKDCLPNGKAKVSRGIKTEENTVDYITTARCANAALDCLRCASDQKDGSTTVAASSENGGLVLLEKLITLKLSDEAEYQSVRLCDQYRKTRPSIKAGQASSGLFSRLRMVSENTAPTHRFATDLQSQLLRLAILRGADCLHEGCTENIQPETDGSPAWMILHGHKLGFFGAEATGNQLRTLSLALSKLQVMITDKRTAPVAAALEGLELGIIALEIKCLSWKHLAHQADFTKELWSPISKLVQKTVSLVRDLAKVQPTAERGIARIRQCLSQYGIPSEIPPALRCYCSEVGQTSQQEDDTVRLGKQLAKLSPDDPQRLLLCLRICLEHMHDWNGATEVAAEYLQQCTDLMAAGAVPMKDLNTVLIAIARLRNAVSSTAIEIGSLQKRDSSTGAYNNLQIASIRFIYGCLSFCHSSDQNTPSSAPPKPKSNTVLMYAKTIENVLAVEKLRVTRSPLLESETHSAIDECVKFAQELRARLDAAGSASEISTFLNGLPVQVSHAFWSRYLHYTEQGRPIAVKLDVLLRSINLVQDCTLQERISAAIGLKHEKLSSLWIEQKAFSKAQSSLVSAIAFAIEQGSLKHAVDASMTQAAGHLHQGTKSASWPLVQMLGAYTSLALKYDVPNCKGTWFFDLDGLTTVERAALLEMQVLAAIEHHAEFVKPGQLRSALQLWEQLCSEPKYSVYQLRTLSQVLHLLGKSKAFDAADIIGSLLDLNDAPTARPIPKDAYLARSGDLVATLVSIQWAFACGTMNEELSASLSARMQTIVAELIKKQILDHIPDPHILLTTLEALADYAGVLAVPQAQAEAAQSYVQLLDHRVTSFGEGKLSKLLTIARAKIELDQTVDAGKTLAAAEKLAQNVPIDALRWHLAYAEYHFSIGNFHKSKEFLGVCQQLFDTASVSTSRDRFDKQTELCRAAHLASQLAMQLGHLASAARFSRQATKLSSGLWSAVEKNLSRSNSPELSGMDFSLHSLTQDLSNMSIVDAKSRQCSVEPRGAKYWSLLSIHRTALRHAARLSAHSGLYQDALFMAQQAAKVTAWTGGLSLRQCTTSELALLYASAGKKDLAMPLIATDGLAPRHPEAAVNFAEAYLVLGHGDDAQRCLAAAQPDSTPAKTVPGVSSRKEPVSTKRGRTAGKTPGRKAAKPSGNSVKDAVSPPSVIKTSVTTRGLTSRVNALADSLHVAGLVSESRPLSANLSGLTSIEILSRALVFVHDAMRHFAADPANNAIAETTLALPVRYRTTRKSGQMSLLLESPVKAQRQPSTEISTTGDGLLHLAHDWLRTIEDNGMSALPSAKVELLHRSLCQIVLLSTALSRPLSYSPLNVVLQSLRPKDTLRRREQCAIAAEQDTATREDALLWPVLGDATVPQDEPFDLMEKLPSSWTVVSIGLSSDGKEMLLSKIIAGRTPFLMRVPLERPALDSDEVCDFTLQYAKEELRDIVRRANETSHDGRGQGDHQTRQAWYADREQLDRQLESLLTNIENVWLGGFRGLLSPHSPDEALLARFGQSLVMTLEKHLPSRQKKGKPKSKVELHAHVLELFTSLSFEESSSDFEDAITDLLYFVVDILQFNGEPNAIDEIDFDAMLLDTIDALRGYHSAVEESPFRHMILVVDKELQAFPWESLPCLRDRPVSRMPSLDAIKARLDQQRSEARNVSRSGAYILNPSGDLTSTQATFAPLLSQLPFESVTSPPTEPEFERLLRDSEILLYFGHGGGTQYIRGRMIRKLPKCAVTWLMGCSSAKLTECGTFESYGVPWHYMHAGSAAVVGTLWDVTDRDIDRFAVKGLGDWGLVDISGVEEKFWGSGKSKAKGKAKAKPTQRRNEKPVALDVAVAGARDACLLRYLNGAAPVIYGIPVMLE